MLLRDFMLNLMLFSPLFAVPVPNDTQQAGPVASVVLIALSAATTAYSQAAAGRARQRQARLNADIKRKAAFDEKRRAEQAISDKQRERDQILGSSRAAVGGAGIALESSTVGGVLEDTAAMSKLDVLRIKSNAERQAWGLEVGATSDLYAGRVARSEGRLGASATLITGASRAVDAWKAS